jgi:hypothetical protein
MGEPLDKWLYVATNGIELVGEKHPTQPRTLQPVLQLLRPLLPGDGHEVGMGLQLMPFLGVGAARLTYPEGALVVPFEAFFAGNDKNWETLISQGLGRNEYLRRDAMQKAGIALVGAGPQRRQS